MLENISPIAYTLAAAILILAILFIGASIILGSEKTGKRVVAIELAFLFWILFQATLSLNRWYMDQKTGALHLLFPFIFPIFIGFLLFLTPRGKKILTGINLRHLLLFQSLRFPIGIMVYMLFQSRQAPVESTFLGWNFDLFFGLLCL
ncbi:MAG: hypothetical protein ACKO8Q_04765 [Bacteroidota bacterium]